MSVYNIDAILNESCKNDKNIFKTIFLSNNNFFLLNTRSEKNITEYFHEIVSNAKLQSTHGNHWNQGGKLSKTSVCVSVVTWQDPGEAR